MDHRTLPKLRINLLGPFEVLLEDRVASGFDSDKVRGLLAYLAVEKTRSHRREALAGLFWPEFQERSARTNLRRALTNLRQVIGDSEAQPPFLEVTRQTIKFNSSSDYQLDIELLARLTDDSSAPPIELEKALQHHRGRFLEGFSLPDCIAFEEWLITTREALDRTISGTYKRLADAYSNLGSIDKSLEVLRKQLQLDPWDEKCHRQIMVLLASSGRRAEAIAHFDELSEVLKRELGVDPDPKTMTLLEQIRGGEIQQLDQLVQPKSVHGYEIRKRINAGSFGVVYKAFQHSVKRDVAIKMIRPEFANQPDFIRRFELEAEIVARLEHPHIVPLYDYWREPDGAFLVMRWLQGGSLRDALSLGPWKPSAVSDLLDQIASALDAAHKQNIVHRDIKPGNILLDGSGNGFLSDFGIATLTEAVQLTGFEPMTLAASRLSGTPEYISPEQAADKPLSPSADIYALGIVVFELLTGQHPYSAASTEKMIECHLKQPLPPLQTLNSNLPQSLNEIVGRAAAKEPAERYPDCLAFAASFRSALESKDAKQHSYVRDRYPVQKNPYKGLQPFLEADASDFFGRDELVKTLITRLADTSANGCLLTVVGPSGSGKSSIVRAGLIPALRNGSINGLDSTGSQKWFYTEMVPGRHPFEGLEAALKNISVRPAGDLLKTLAENDEGIMQAVRHALPDRESKVFLLIDQFEELFTLCQVADERDSFLAGLSKAIRSEDSQLVLTITLRADYYDRPLQYREFGELIKDSTEVVLPMSNREIEMAIQQPAANVGIGLEPGLVDIIIRDVHREPGALPLLQYALTELFEHRQGRHLTLESYAAIGTVAGAIGQRAEELYLASEEHEKEAARQLFLRLVIPGREIQDARRRTLRSDLMGLKSNQFGDISADLETVLEWYGRSRLLTFDVESSTREPTVEIAHEALLREWGRLKEWIDGNREEIDQFQKLSQAAAEWVNSGHDSSFLLRGTRLDGFIELAETSDLASTSQEDSYLSASIKAHQQRVEARRIQQEQQQSLERRTRNQRLALFIVVLIALVGAIGAVVIITADLTSEVVQAITSPQNSEDDFVPESTRIASLSKHLAYSIPQGRGVQYRPGGSQIAISGSGNAASLYDSQTGKFVRDLVGHSDRINNIAYSADGERIATTSLDGTVKVWDGDSGELIRSVGGTTGELVSPALSPDGLLVAATNYNDEFKRLTAHIWDIDTGEEIAIVGLGDSVGGLVFHPDGQLIAIPGEDGKATIWDIDSENQIDILYGGQVAVSDLVFDRSGQRLATASFDGIVRVFDVESNEVLSTIRGDETPLYAIDISPDGTRIATGAADGSVRLYDIKNGREILSLFGHERAVYNVSFSPDGEYLASGGEDDTTVVWSISE